ncbi:HNH endonuclease [Vibrio phage JSF3]|uniref:Putative HNH homing endonuclease n=2 Tax=Pacinivirus VCO139 TaxID=2846607 RepID=R9R4M0_9CAUD|nr:HNH endonuclease [Vibrio phage JA-1]YP_009874334.1 HNH endonuclease [Vibrio phage VCO139]YP_009876288.1 HNH endonuclease [Vibrio phage JSF3]AGI61785.1 putative HNH homing endonuclease [Vibrio phage JA-1]AGI61862.1 putative HNH homing endonuclease [Vibrio phage VCO139]APD18075.1 HNH homing endonuclease [Vibrio phage JSF3]
MHEIYLPIPEFENYEVSNFGNVRSTKRTKPILLKPDVTNHQHTQYARVTLSKEGITYRIAVHRLVAKVFIPNPHNKPHVNHIDNNGINNHVSNLEWCTHVENMQHSAKQGRQDLARKLGCEAASAKCELEMNQRFKIEMGDRFIKSETEGNRRYVTYVCKFCRYTYKTRSDLMPIKRHGICNSCAKEQDIV